MMNATTKQILEETLVTISEPFKASIREGYTTGARRTIEKYLAECNNLKLTDPSYIWPQKSFSQSREVYRSMAAKQAAIRPYIRETAASCEKNKYVPYPTREYEVLPNVEEVISQRAIKYAEAAVAAFVAKMTRKFMGIVDMHDGTVSIRSGGSLSWNTINFDFSDGTSFRVENKVVIKVNQYGTVFNQFPTTFHNVKLANGTHVKNASESKLKKLFKGEVAA
jgi:hypothetical protein